ncbi:MAG: hypothetical protein OK455_06510 [Thaumarchaeota archaeon]|nr:hypothetical protein [Nitrososphaerota archaeon]
MIKSGVKRQAVLVRATALGLALVLIVAGGLAVYYYTLPPKLSGGLNAATASGAIKVLPDQATGAHFITVEYNGTSYQVPEKGPNSPTFGCPVGEDPAVCNLLHQTCGNGAGPAQEPWKTCSNCIFDAGCTGNQSCDPYTHECSSPATACMVAVYGGG